MTGAANNARTAPKLLCPQLVNATALHQGGVAEHLLDARGERLGAVDDAEHARLDVEAPGHQIGQQGGDDGLVLGVAEPEPDGDLGAVGCDDQGDHGTRAGHVEPVDHEHGHVEVGEVPGHQLVHGLARGRHEAPGDCRLGHGLGALLELCSDWLGHVSVASGGHPGQHALDDEGVEQIGRAEHLPGVEPDLLPRRAASPRALGGDLAPAENDRTLRVAVPVSDTLLGRDLGVLLADRFGQFGLHHLSHHDEACGRRERQ